MVLLILVSGCRLLWGGSVQKNSYYIDVYYEPHEASIFGSQELSYRNTEDTELSSIYFHLYPNAFREKETAPMIGSVEDNYPEGFNPGQIDIINVRVDGKIARWDIEGKDRTILAVKLREPVKANDRVDIKIDFQEKLPRALTDFCSYYDIACFENWYPVLCIYDMEGWHKEPSCRMGEANFSEISDYEVNINLPSDEVVASSGECVREKDMGSGRKLITLEAEDVRDFTWISSPKFEVVQKKVEGVTIKSYFLDEDKEKGVSAIDYATRAIRFFSDTFGEYPYDTFSVVETPLYGGAMEYPLLTSVGILYYRHENEKLLEGAVAHEAAHQWWYVVVGNNEYREPWLDESLATYSEAMYFEKYYGREGLKSRLSTRIGISDFSRSTADSMDRFISLDEYNMVVYMKGAYILDQLRNKVGDEKYLEAIRRYYSKYKFKNASTQDFLSIMEDVCGTEAAEFVKARISGAK